MSPRCGGGQRVPSPVATGEGEGGGQAGAAGRRDDSLSLPGKEPGGEAHFHHERTPDK